MGYTISKVGRADRFDYPHSTVYYGAGGHDVGVRLARQLGVTDTDQMSPRYERYIAGAKRIFAPEHPTLVASGHEHSLQVHVDPTGVFHAVSGAGSTRKVDYVRDMKSDLMALAAPGYMRLDAYADATLRLNVYAVGAGGASELAFSTCIP
jgi:hypothetical protein